MGTLKVKGVPEALLLELCERARRHGRSLSQEVVHILSAHVESDARLNILDLEGLGKEIWVGVDPVSHVEAERAGWD